MNINDSALSTRIKVGVFALLGLLLIGAVTVFVNDRPFWWRKCSLVYINVEDATGLKNRSPVRSLGLQIGYLKSVSLSNDFVRLGICITAPVEPIPGKTKAYIRGEGFLGDKFVELKPMKYLGGEKNVSIPQWIPKRYVALSGFISQWANANNSSDIPVDSSGENIQEMVGQVNKLVGELTELTQSFNHAVNPKELHSTMTELNRTLRNAASTLSPQGGLTETAQKALTRLENAIIQMEDMMTRVNNGEGSVGRVLNDPVFADQLELALRNTNKLLNKASGMRVRLNLFTEQLTALDGTRSSVQIGIWPDETRYYLLGASFDPRGSIETITTTTTVGGTSSTSQTTTQNEGGLLITAMLGKVLFDRLDLSAGLLHGDGALGLGIYLGPESWLDQIRIQAEIYARAEGTANSKLVHARAYAMIFPSGSPYLKTLYLRGGLESHRKFGGKTSWSIGGGISFDDDDIKLLFSFL